MNLTPGDAVYHPGQGPVAVDPGVRVDDPDSPGGIARATVYIANPIDAPLEILVATSPSGLLAVYDANLGVLNLSGAASTDTYTQALQSITYKNSQATALPARVIGFQAEDADGNLSPPTTRSLQIASLLHYYTFNGNFEDSASTRHLGIAISGNGGLGPPQLVPGPFSDGSATRTDVVHFYGGNTDFTYLSNTSGTFQTHCTVMAWANSDVQSPGSNRAFFSNGPVSTSHFQFDNNQGVYGINGGVGGRISFQPVVANRWTHICATWDGIVTNLYADGVLVNSRAGNLGDLFARLSVGSNRNTLNGFGGYVDDVGVFSYALDEQRIAAVHALGRFYGRNLDSPDLDGFLAAFNAGPGGSILLDGDVWIYVPAATLDAGTSVGATGGNLAAGNAYVVMDRSGNGMFTVDAPQFVPVSGGALALAAGVAHPSVTLGLVADSGAHVSAMTASLSDPSPLGAGNARVWESGAVAADIDATGPGAVAGTSVPLVVTVSNGFLSSSATVVVTLTGVPDSPPGFLAVGAINGVIGETTVALGVATIWDDVGVTSVTVAYAPPEVAATVRAVTPLNANTVVVDLDVGIGLLVAPGTYPIRLMAHDGKRATIGTVPLTASGDSGAGTPTGDALDILAATGVMGGLIVHLGCGDGSLTAALGENSKCIVQGLDEDPANVDLARDHIASLGLYGRVTAEPWSGERLPYIDNTVNLIVADELTGIDMDELMRVLAPRGIAYLKYGDAWRKYDKPRPEWIDEWTHYMHDPSNNAVADDEAVRHPRQLQWTAPPRWSRHHDHKSSVNGLVSANGRVFYILDEGSRRSICLPDRLALIARDAFNGALLWKRSFETWHTHLWPLKSGPAQLPRRLVAIGDKVYVTLGTDAPVTCLDAATGDVLHIYNQTRTAEEILYHDGVLFLQVDESPTSKTYNTVAEIKTDSRTDWWSGQSRWITAVEADTGKVLWRIERPIAPMTLAASDRGVFYYNGDRVVRLNRADGLEIWQSNPIPCRPRILSEHGPRLVLYEDMVLFAGNESTTGADTMRGLSADTGQILWTVDHPPSGYRSPEDILVADGLVWTGATTKGNLSGDFTGRDPWTGQIVRQFGPDVQTHWFHHRCYFGKGTNNYLLMSRTGVEFLDVNTFHWTPHHWVRGSCLYGVMPCNGLLYAPPHDCACYAEAKLYGFCALAPNTASGTTINRGPNLVDNSDFESGDAPWQFLPAAGDAYRHQRDDTGYVALMHIWADKETGHIRQNLPISAGRRYRVAFDLPYWGQQPNLAGQFLIDLGGAVQASAVADGRVEGIVTAGAGGYLEIKPVGKSGEIAIVDNVNVRRMATLAEDLGTPAPEKANVAPSTSGNARLVQGPAYGTIQNPKSAIQNVNEWPTYRRDTARSGFTTAAISLNLQQAWKSRIGGRLSALVLADAKAFVSSIDQHTVYALRVSDGGVVWKYMTGGRVDSPPTYHDGRIYFGCTDGWVYCLRADDGVLVWRYRAAPEERQLVAFDHLESVWPVHGNVLVYGGSVYCVSGRSMFLDGGLRFLRLDAQTGAQLHEAILDDRDPATSENLQIYVNKLNMTVALPDILTYDGRYIYMRSMPLNEQGVRQHIPFRDVTDQVGEYTHLFAPGSFVDGDWFHRHYWVYGQSYASGAGGYYLAGRNAPSGRILTHNASAVFGFGRKPQYFRWTTPLEYRLFRAPIPRTLDTGGSLQTFTTDWIKDVPIFARAMVLAGDTLFIAGPQDVVDEEVVVDNLSDPIIQSWLRIQEAALAGQSGAVLMAVSTSDGAVLAQYHLSHPPVWDGMAAAYGSLFLSTIDGEVIRLAPPGPSTSVDSWKLYD